MKFSKMSVLLGGLLLTLAGCAGGSGSHSTPASPQDNNATFTWHGTAPFANPLPHHAQDVGRTWPAGTFQDSAAVLVYADHGNQTYVLMARRAPWLSSAGTWSVFMGGVERTDLDSSGAISFARAAEHELFEESVTVYHQADANDLRRCPSDLRTFRSGRKSRTFFARLPFVPEAQLNQGYAFAVQSGKDKKFKENDQFRWVLLQDLAACTAPTWDFTDVTGTRHSMNLFRVFFETLERPDYKNHLRALP